MEREKSLVLFRICDRRAHLKKMELLAEKAMRDRVFDRFGIHAGNSSLNGKSIKQINIEAGRSSAISNEIETILDIVKMGSADMGILRPGMFADIVIFDANKVKDQSTFEHPHACSTGFKYVLVNGTLTVNNFKHIGARKGVTLRGPGYHQKQ